MNFKVDLNADVNGTHRQGQIEARYADLERLFGEPMESDGYKVSGEWAFVSDTGEVFTLYDWKSTSLYDSYLPSVESFRLNRRPQWFNIGGHGDASKFIAWLNKKLAKAA